MSLASPPRPFHVHLTGDPAGVPAEGRLRAAADGVAALELGEVVTLTWAVPARPRAELRWLFEQLVASVDALVGVGAVELTSRGIDEQTLTTLALDLYARSRGKLRIGGSEAASAYVARVGMLEELYRDWVDEDPSTRTSIAIARDVSDWAARRDDVEVEVLAEDTLRERGLRLLLAVGQGSRVSPPRLILARYRPSGASQPPLVLLGKGITFDSGGINVKPYESFVSMMKNDMAGAALAVALFRGLVEAGYPRPLTLVVPTCENAIGPDAMRPGAVVKSYRGPTVRVDHTDAEGRLILADALAYATDVASPRQVLCFATLTTAALIAYGPYATPVHFADAELAAALGRAADATGEDLHFFPERIWHLQANRDREADLRNTARLPGNASRGAGSRNAAHFLRHFTDCPLVHFDIFASTWNWAQDAPGGRAGATGAPLRTLLAALES